MDRPGRAIIGSDTERREIGMSAEAYFRAVQELVAHPTAAGEPPPVFISDNLDGGDAYNAERLRENAGRIFYL